eukprot:CAMPEP_0184670902 /NCGR_PEP_ID=MMETSP0308-20130426/84492_1 /TAXON_ID=38269 /ORGANISM="Gloeochaete witrockiana, Strain SAG 46.84" /LENGTH=79 /DNA_ID=CAMNT_0027117833 /DNA_START=14 /DNA_END=250 /DNA_ORIENTATION=+
MMLNGLVDAPVEECDMEAARLTAQIITEDSGGQGRRYGGRFPTRASKIYSDTIEMVHGMPTLPSTYLPSLDQAQQGAAA